jgi:hypothetical protein
VTETTLPSVIGPLVTVASPRVNPLSLIARFDRLSVALLRGMSVAVAEFNVTSVCPAAADGL